MNVAAILRQKGRAVTTTSPSTTMLEVTRKLAAKRIGAIVIVGAKGTVAGIISERDIIRLSFPARVGEHDPRRDQLPGG